MLASELLGKEWDTILQDMEITGIAYDSRQVLPGYAFVCISGFETDGHKYADAAIKNGASLIVAENKVDSCVPVCYVNDTRKTLADMSCAFYENQDGHG